MAVIRQTPAAPAAEAEVVREGAPPVRMGEAPPAALAATIQPGQEPELPMAALDRTAAAEEEAMPTTEAPEAPAPNGMRRTARAAEGVVVET